MHAQRRLTAAVVFAGAAMTGLVLAQEPPAPPSAPDSAGQAGARRPSLQTAAATMRGSGAPGVPARPRTGEEAGAAASRSTPDRRLHRTLGARQGLYYTKLRGVVSRAGPPRYGGRQESEHAAFGIALRDPKGELVTAVAAQHAGADVTEADTVSKNRGIHPQRSRPMGGQGSPGPETDQRHAQRPRGRREGRRGDVLGVCGACHP